MNGANYLIEALSREGVSTVFGYPGGAIMPVYDALAEAPFRHILTRHEQAAIMAADGYARASGDVGVCLATSGPGATNLVTGLANALADSVPIVAITGQVPTSLIGTDAFQEVDVLGMTLGLVKHSYLPRDTRELAHAIPEAFRLARSGRPGPVIIDLPKDVAQADAPPLQQTRPLAQEIKDSTLDERTLEKARRLLVESRKPILYAGGGIRIGRAVGEFRRFAETTGIPVVTTLQGVGVLSSDHPQHLGMIGMHGSTAANRAVQECDLLVAIGARFDDRATGRLASFAPHAKVLHLDIDPAELGKLRRPSVSIPGELGEPLRQLSKSMDHQPWLKECRQRISAIPSSTSGPISAPAFLRALSHRAPKETTVTCDVGQHQMWVAQSFSFHSPDRHLTSGGLGAMGYGLPAAIGAQLARPEERVITVSGDGSIMMNLQEFATLQRYELPIKIVVFDNSCLGMVRQWQDLFFEGRLSQVDLSDNPDFTEVARSFGIPSCRLDDHQAMPEVLDRLIEEPGPLFVHIPVPRTENVWPLVPPGASNGDMIQGAEK